ncbi:Gfo/Idh/MocA family oxidoreductase, partial [Thermodesulfovibrionales bacterium]|nr:Gfo/Idh/MocA family oxidoreductase [Thermodesulfovibrionales bacterium]
MEKSIAVIGAGYWGKNLVRNFWELGALSTVCDAGIDRLQVFKSKYPDIKTTSSFKEVLKDEDIKGVVIATPAVHHYQMTKEALLSHKDVFVEKPLALKISEGEELVSLAKEQKRILMVGHILQYHPAVIKLKEMIEAGELGKIQYIYSNRLNIGKLRTEENILWSFAPHDISVILMLLNEEPIRVTAFGGRYITEGVYDTTLTTLEFKNGIRGHIFVSWLHPYKEQKLIVVGTKAMAVFDDVSKEKLFIYPHKIDYIGGKIPIAQKVEYYNILLENKEPLKEELKHFIECINERKQPQTDGEEGLRILRILEEAERYLSSSLTLEH